MTRRITDTVEINDGVVKMSGILMPSIKTEDIQGMILNNESYPFNINDEQQKQMDSFYNERELEFEKLKEQAKNFVDKYLVGSLQIEYNVLEANEWVYFHDTYHEKLIQNLGIA